MYERSITCNKLLHSTPVVIGTADFCPSYNYLTFSKWLTLLYITLIIGKQCVSIQSDSAQQRKPNVATELGYCVWTVTDDVSGK